MGWMRHMLSAVRVAFRCALCCALSLSLSLSHRLSLQESVLFLKTYTVRVDFV